MSTKEYTARINLRNVVTLTISANYSETFRGFTGQKEFGLVSTYIKVHTPIYVNFKYSDGSVETKTCQMKSELIGEDLDIVLI